MGINKSIKKIAAGLLAVSLVLGSSAAVIGFPAPYAHAAATATVFKDIPTNYWAEKHIAKLYLQGIVNGYTPTTFEPNKNITQQEAVLMALRFSGLSEKVNNTAGVEFGEGFKVKSTFYAPYVALAIQEGLLDSQIEYSIAKEEKLADWGTIPASREWVTKLIIKAISKEQEAKALQNVSSSFNDAADVDFLYKGYVNFASQSGLVTGITTERFAPKADVTRASFATLISRAEKFLDVEHASQTTGVITEVTDNSLTIYSSGFEKQLKLDEASLYYHVDSVTQLEKSSIKPYTEVRVIEKDGRAGFVEIISDKQFTASLKATLLWVDNDKKVFNVRINNDAKTVSFVDKIKLTDQEGLPLSLSDLKENTEITFTLETFRESPVAVAATWNRPTKATEVGGLFYRLAEGQTALILKTDDVLETKLFASRYTVEIPGVDNPALSDLQPEADKIKLRLNDEGKIISVVVTNRDVQIWADARISNYDPKNRLITLVDSNGKNGQALYVTDRTQFEYLGTGIQLAAIEGIIKTDQRVVVTYTGHASGTNNIVKLRIINGYEGDIVGINEASGTLRLMLPEGAAIELPYKGAAVDARGKVNVKLTELKTGDRITAVLNNTQTAIGVIRLHTAEQYEISALQDNIKRVSLRSLTTVPSEVSAGSIVLKDEAGKVIEYSSLRVGQTVNVSYSGSQAIGLQIVKNEYGRISAIGTSSVTVMDGAGQSKVYSNDTKGFTVVKGSSQTSGTAALKAGDFVELRQNADGKTRVAVASAVTHTFERYESVGKLIRVKKQASSSTDYFFINDQTFITSKGSTIAVTDLKAGDTLHVYAFGTQIVAIDRQ